MIADNVISYLCLLSIYLLLSLSRSLSTLYNGDMNAYLVNYIYELRLFFNHLLV
jgi:hypothetical protein